MVMARVQPGKRAELASALEGLFAAAGESPASYSVSDDLMVVSTRRRTWRGPSLTWGRAPAPRLRQPSGSGTGAAWAG